ncbi:MAG TPA: lycopene beta-cyclase CrtY [Variovorax sp.]|nr:lycopene beta-cyclase CrtY [Variovorax sp.]
MPHFAILAPPFTSHIRALEALADALHSRGHRISWLHQADVGALIRSPHVEFHALGAATHPSGSLDGVVARAARPGGPSGLRRVIRDVAEATDMLCREAPGRLRALGVDVVIADQMEAAGGLVAAHLGLPFVSVACALPVNREPRVPLPVMHWALATDPAGLQMNQGSERVYDWLMRPHAEVIARHAAAFGLPPRTRIDQCLSPSLQLAQTVAGFDFAREAAPAVLQAVGPLRGPMDAEEALERHAPGIVHDRPFVFASLGTLQGGRFRLFLRIARACRDVGAQVLVAHCDRLDARQADALRRAGATWVTGFAPQRDAVARADVVITHAGLNTVMDALAAGKPMLALPIAFDQPGCAARVVHAGAGLRILPGLATSGAIRKALRRLLDEPRFAEAARSLAPAVRAAGGTALAVGLIERMLSSRAVDVPSVASVRPPHGSDATACDLLLVGGGLSNGLIALRLAQQRPDLRVIVLERDDAAGGNHTWSFHDADLDAAQNAWVAPLVAHRWPAHGVRFPQCRRRVEGGYASITSSRFDAVLRQCLGDRLVFGAAVQRLDAHAVTLADGRVLTARCVIDGRGARPSPHLALGFQKFLGQEIRTTAPHGLSEPVLMDATVDQHDAYRFVYLLPFTSDTLLVEDTYYADGAALDDAVLRERIAAYVHAQGWRIAEVLREERGVLPIVLAGDAQAFWRDAADGAVPVGLAAALFHPTTGYSLPDAVRLADRLAALPDVDAPAVRAAVRDHALATWRDRSFFRLLNRMLFRAAEPSRRWRVMQRFYGLPAPLIARFYAGRPTLADQLRILMGKPPVPLGAALRAALATDLRGTPELQEKTS